MLDDALAAYRLTRLVTADTILAEPRNAIARWAYHRAAMAKPAEPLPELAYTELAGPQPWADLAMDDPDAPKLATLVTCRWCAGVWVAFGVVAARRLFPRAWQPVARALALSAGAALLARLED